MKIHFRKAHIVRIALLLLCARSLTANTIEFEPGVTGTITATAGSGVGQYVEDGVTVDAIDAQNGKHFHLFQDNTPGPTTWILIFANDSHGAVFSFGGIAVDLITVDFWSPVPGTLTSSTGGIASYAKPSAGVGSIDFTALTGWKGITSFTWTFTDPSVIGQDDIPSGLDNLVFQPSAVPEPATWALLLSGLAGLLVTRGRR